MRMGQQERASAGARPDDYALERMKARRTQIAIPAVLVVLLLLRQLAVAGVVPTLVGTAVAASAFAVLLLAVRVRASRTTGDDCPALLPVWATGHGAELVRVKNPNATLTGTLVFSDGSIEWLPSKGSERLGARPVRWAIATPRQVRLFNAGRLASQTLVTVLGPQGELVADVWARATRARALRLAALATPGSPDWLAPDRVT